jgi:hypothetical protein
MGAFRSFLILMTGVAIGGALVIAHRVSQETGKSLPEAFGDVPGETRKMYEDFRFRAEEAVARGRDAYEQKQAEMETYLSGGAPAE